MFYKDGFFKKDINDYDPILSKSLNKELNRQQYQIELIASENIVSKSVLQAQGSVLTNKYAEGYFGKRYYGGCEYVDEVEKLAIDRAKTLLQICECATTFRCTSKSGCIFKFIKPW